MKPSSNIKNIAIKYGGFYALLYILILVVKENFNIESQLTLSILGVGGIILSFLMVWQATNEYKAVNENKITLSSALKVGLAIGAIGGIIYAVFMFINYSFIDNEAIELARQEAQNQLNLSTNADDEISKNAFIFGYATIALLSQLFRAFVFGLIIGLINRSKSA